MTGMTMGQSTRVRGMVQQTASRDKEKNGSSGREGFQGSYRACCSSCGTKKETPESQCLDEACCATIEEHLRKIVKVLQGGPAHTTEQMTWLDCKKEVMLELIRRFKCDISAGSQVATLQRIYLETCAVCREAGSSLPANWNSIGESLRELCWDIKACLGQGPSYRLPMREMETAALALLESIGDIEHCLEKFGVVPPVEPAESGTAASSEQGKKAPSLSQQKKSKPAPPIGFDLAAWSTRVGHTLVFFKGLLFNEEPSERQKPGVLQIIAGINASVCETVTFGELLQVTSGICEHVATLQCLIDEAECSGLDTTLQALLAEKLAAVALHGSRILRAARRLTVEETDCQAELVRALEAMVRGSEALLLAIQHPAGPCPQADPCVPVVEDLLAKSEAALELASKLSCEHIVTADIDDIETLLGESNDIILELAENYDVFDDAPINPQDFNISCYSPRSEIAGLAAAVMTAFCQTNSLREVAAADTDAGGAVTSTGYTGVRFASMKRVGNLLEAMDETICGVLEDIPETTSRKVAGHLAPVQELIGRELFFTRQDLPLLPADLQRQRLQNGARGIYHYAEMAFARGQAELSEQTDKNKFKAAQKDVQEQVRKLLAMTAS